MVLSCTFLSKHKQQHIPSREKQVGQWNNYKENRAAHLFKAGRRHCKCSGGQLGHCELGHGKKKTRKLLLRCNDTVTLHSALVCTIPRPQSYLRCMAEIATNLSFLSLLPFIFRVLAGNKAYTLHSLLLRVTLANQHYRRFLVELRCFLFLGSSGFPLQGYEADFITGPMG